MLRRSSYLAAAGQDVNDWLRKVFDWASTFLLALLPIVTRLTLSPWYIRSVEIYPEDKTYMVLSVMVERANDLHLAGSSLGQVELLKPTWTADTQFAESMRSSLRLDDRAGVAQIPACYQR